MCPLKSHSSNSKPYDLLLGAHFLKITGPLHASTAQEPHGAYEYLYPYGFDCLQIILPRTTSPPVSVIQRVLRVGQVQAIILGAIGFAIGRRLLGLRGREGDECLYTLGLCMSQMAIRRQRRMRRRPLNVVAERIAFVWTWSLAVYSTFAMAWLSAVVYVKIVSQPVWNDIDTLAELHGTDVTIYVADVLSDIGDWWSSLRYICTCINVK